MSRDAIPLEEFVGTHRFRETEGISPWPSRRPRAFSQLFPNADPVLEDETIEESRHYEWLYNDETGLTQGPFPATKILAWIRAGHFTPQTLFRREDRTSTMPLADALPYLQRAELAEIRQGWAAALQGPDEEHKGAKPKKVVDKETKQLRIEVEPAPLLDLENFRATAGESVKGLFKPEPDLNVILIPPYELTEDSPFANTLCRNLNIPKVYLTKLESDGGTMLRCQKAFAEWLMANKSVLEDMGLDQDVPYGNTAIVCQAHSMIIKSASPLLLKTVEAAEELARKMEYEAIKAADESQKNSQQASSTILLIRTAHPEAVRLIIRKLHQ